MNTDKTSLRESSTSLALATLLALIEDYHDFNPDTIVPVHPCPTALQFSQQVARARPCVYRRDRNISIDQDPVNGHVVPKVNRDASSLREENFPTPLYKDSQSRDLLEEHQSIFNAPCFRWTRKTLGDLVQKKVEVAITPDGKADSMYLLPRYQRRLGQWSSSHNDQSRSEDPSDEHGRPIGPAKNETDEMEHVFLQPATKQMTLSDLIDKLCPAPSSTLSSLRAESGRGPVYYLQSQNSNLSLPPLSSLLSHLPATAPPFSLAVLGEPEATNIWIGSEQSVTSTHRDPYENLYLVVKGRKKFVLYPPVEEICLHAKMVRTGRWVYDTSTGKFEVEMDGENVDGQHTARDGAAPSSDSHQASKSTSSEEGSPRLPWIPVDPYNPPSQSSKTYPYYKHARPLNVTVNEEEILYLPAGWFHHVMQECGQWEDGEGNLVRAPCIAVNYWFDMDYSPVRNTS